jgi:hypothetical protein
MTGEVLQFPFGASPVSRAARAIYRDICNRPRCLPGGHVPHSVADGVACTGANKALVVKARRLLIECGLLVQARAGDHMGPTEWIVTGGQERGAA